MSATVKTTVQLEPTTPQSTTKGKAQLTTKSKAKTQQQPPKKSKTKEESKPTKKSKTKELPQPTKKSNTKAPTKTQTKPQPTTKALIVILGRVGVGKSSFINTLAGNDDLRVGHSMERETRQSSVVEISRPNSEDTIAFLDSPGIDGDRPVDEVLRYLNGWLKRSA
ncbi:uncharacterized protein LACBIDRAFT_302569 [Laccaria bicolor S238N-H82]|uniref:Predicted protein n=1 Tax=Laccaria bicolor (strain S238N-H82 / ATCC MYA-4686) TaxID=486041 RepID=B0DHW9_LACBS|nr:uncharacterized protein LACBIDRAFT_302569 [Laccaria bicolor S238N-H82]EDR05801.1 predicted protein [Laccaria bicolor S238N-H82]|eukprot:XP_001883477.1 predicted protein [Laccaria bicolor S238N-H82]